MNSEKAKEGYLTAIITNAALRRIRRAEDVPDCIVIFLEKALAMPEAQEWPFSEQSKKRIASVADRCAATEAERLRRLRIREVFLIGCCGCAPGREAEPASPDIGPEHRAIVRNVIELIRSAVKRFPRSYRALFVAVFVEHKTHVDIAKAVGTSRQAVDQRTDRLVSAIRDEVGRAGLTDGEIDDLLLQLGRTRSKRGVRPRRAAGFSG
jgi:DNA-directed RNA polymerase specialized sigma24 family protein